MGDGFRGLGTGAKAVVNGTVQAAVSTGTLGFVEAGDTLAVNAWDRSVGYNTSVAIAGTSANVAFGVATGGLAQSARLGRLGSAINAFDATGNALEVGRGSIDVYNSGRLTWESGLQIAGGLGGLAGNARGAGQFAEDFPRANPLNYELSASRSTLSANGLGGVGAKYVGTPVPRQGIYEFPDATAAGKPYIGQSGNIPQRLLRHQQSGRLTEGIVPTIVDIPGGRTAREIAEHQRIQVITGQVPARYSKNVANQRDPIGPNRLYLLDNK